MITINRYPPPPQHTHTHTNIKESQDLKSNLYE